MNDCRLGVERVCLRSKYTSQRKKRHSTTTQPVSLKGVNEDKKSQQQGLEGRVLSSMLRCHKDNGFSGKGVLALVGVMALAEGSNGQGGGQASGRLGPVGGPAEEGQ